MKTIRALSFVVISLILASASSQPAKAGSCSESTAFLARTSGLDGTHKTAYDNLICGLVTDGVWAKLDILYILATQDSATALLNLTSSSYAITVHNTPTFTVDRGYQANCCTVDNIATPPGSGDWLDTGFAYIFNTTKYTDDEAHLSVWNITNANSTAPIIGDGGNDPYMYIKLQGNFYPAINATAALTALSIGTPTGHLIGTRWCPNGYCSNTILRVVTITIASPAVITTAAPHTLVAGVPVVFMGDFSTDLPTGLVKGTTYYVIAAGLTATQFQVSATLGGTAVNTSGTQSGTPQVRGLYTTITGYQNGTSLGDITDQVPDAPPVGTVSILQKNTVRHNLSDTAHQIAMASVGGALNATDASNFNSRLRAYMTAVGVP